jgi:hypothetical protein
MNPFFEQGEINNRYSARTSGGGGMGIILNQADSQLKGNVEDYNPSIVRNHCAKKVLQRYMVRSFGLVLFPTVWNVFEYSTDIKA